MASEAPLIGRDLLGRPVRDLSKESWWGLPREQVPWYPRVDYARCRGCGLCFLTCGRAVYDWDLERGRPTVARPYNCMVGCTTCANLCPNDAIGFPSIAELRKWRDKAQAVAKAKEALSKLRAS